MYMHIETTEKYTSDINKRNNIAKNNKHLGCKIVQGQSEATCTCKQAGATKSLELRSRS